MFLNWGALKKHLISPAHSRMTVICPWCVKREKTFTRVSDLKQHAMNAHKSQGINERDFSRGVGFYYAKYPEDYVKIAECIETYSSEEAGRARSAMRSWAETMENRDILLEKLAKGWKSETNKREERRPYGEKRSWGRDMDSTTQKRRREERVEESVKVPDSSNTQCRDNRKVVKESKDRRDSEVTVRKESVEPTVQSTTEKEKENSVEDSFNAYEDNIDLLDEASTSSGSTSSSGSSVSSTPSQPPMPKDSEFKARATRILMAGAMPMCPPAQRDWSKVEWSIECTNGELKWPPGNWQSMSADQKLMAHEYAAIFLEHARRPKFPDLSRRTLLDKYNFLALEGAARPKAETGKPRVDCKLRFYNYEFVLGVARGTIKRSVVSEGVIASLENAVRWTDADYLIEKLDATNIKLRV